MTTPPDAPMTTNGTDLDLRALAEKVARERFNAVIGVHRYSVPPVWDKMADSFRADCIGYVEAGLRAQAPSLVLTDAAFCAAYRVFYETATGDADILEAEGRLLAFFRALLAERTSQAPSLLEAKRETWDAARDWAGEWWGCNAIPGREKDFDAERDRRFPLPAPAGITLSDGSVVRRNANPEFFKWTRSWSHGAGHSAQSGNDWRTLVDTPEEFATVKAYAAEQSEAR